MKLSVDVDIIIRNLFTACNCVVGNAKYQKELSKMNLQERYTLPIPH